RGAKRRGNPSYSRPAEAIAFPSGEGAQFANWADEGSRPTLVPLASPLPLCYNKYIRMVADCLKNATK
ncbi:MAG: hypothetical protein RR336_12650, partial [Oscillospiraceae bacterium]